MLSNKDLEHDRASISADHALRAGPPPSLPDEPAVRALGLSAEIDHLHPAVARLRRLRRRRYGQAVFTFAHRLEAGAIDAELPDQVVHHAVRAFLRQGLVQR